MKLPQIKLSLHVFPRAMFCNELKEKYEEKIIIKGVDAETMEIILDYAYTSKMVITKQNVQKILEAASLFQVSVMQLQRYQQSHVKMCPLNCIYIVYTILCQLPLVEEMNKSLNKIVPVVWSHFPYKNDFP